MLEPTPPKRNGISMSATRYIYHKAGPLALIPEVGTLTYPYAYIVKTDDAIELYFTTNAITTSSSTSSTGNAYFVFRGNAKKYSYLEDANTWLYLGEENVQGATHLISNLMWANDKVSYSIVNQNGSTSTYTAVSTH
jgi:hypothetical protein